MEGYCYLFVGHRLAPLEADMQSFGEARVPSGWGSSVAYSSAVSYLPVDHTQLAGCKATDNSTLLNGDAMNQEDWRKKLEGQAQSMTFRDICTFRLLLACVFRT
jgi:hypothetical protein